MKSGDTGFDNVVAVQVKGQGMWENFDIAEGMYKYAIYENDFTRYPDLDMTNEWTVTTKEDGSGSATEVIRDDIDFGIARLLNAAGDNDWDCIQFTAANGAGEFISLEANKALFFEARVAISDITQSDAFIGLCITDTDISDTGTGVPEASDYIGFAKDDGDAYWDFVAAINSTETAQAAIATGTDGTFVILGFYIDGTSKAICWINGVKGPPISTNLPTDEQMCLTLFVQNGEGVAKSIDIDYVRVYRER